MTKPLTSSLISTLKECARTGNLEKGKRAHTAFLEKGKGDVLVANTVINMYTTCGCIAQAESVFQNITSPTTASWNSLMKGYVENGLEQQALDLFSLMQRGGVSVDARTFVNALKACAILASRSKLDKPAALESGRAIHCLANKYCVAFELFVASTLIDMYAKCGSVEDARMVFDRMPSHTVVTWNSLMMGYVENGEEQEALKLFEQVPQADNVSFVAAIKACSGLALLEKGMWVHSRANEFLHDILVVNTLVDMYAKCGSLFDSRRVFDTMHSRTTASWNALLMGYVENGEEKLALELFAYMRTELQDSRTFVAALKACARLEALEEGERVHSEAVKNGCGKNMFVMNTLVDMYVKCGSMQNARRVFDSMNGSVDDVSCTSLMLGYAENGQEDIAMEIFEGMRCEPDAQVLYVAVKVCTGLGDKENGTSVSGKTVKIRALEKGMALHMKCRRRLENVFLASALVEMYVKCGSMYDARKLFDQMVCRDVVCWTLIILGHVEIGEEEIALDLFERMECVPDSTAVCAALRACVSLGNGLETSRRVLKCCSLPVDEFVANALLEMYVRVGKTDEAQAVFSKMPCHGIVSSTLMMVGYVECGKGEVALDMYCLVMGNTRPDTPLLAMALKACGSCCSAEKGKAVEGDIYRLGFHALETCVIDMYTKCGSLVGAKLVFDTSCIKDSATWNSILTAYSKNGACGEMLEVFGEMLELHVYNGVSFLIVLNGLNHSGYVEECEKCFSVMGRYGVVPDIEHYHCMVDMLGRVNRIEDAVEVVRDMPFEANAVTWRTLLGACQKWKNADVAKLAFDKLEMIELDAAAYNMMSNTYTV